MKDSPEGEARSDSSSARVRLDVWLDVSCLFRTRSEAKHACTAGRVEVNGAPAKPHRLVQAGDSIVISRGYGARQTIVVRGVAETSIPKAEARRLYEDRTPPPTPEEIEMRRMDRRFRALHAKRPAPDKRARRALRALRGR